MAGCVPDCTVWLIGHGYSTYGMYSPSTYLDADPEGMSTGEEQKPVVPWLAAPPP